MKLQNACKMTLRAALEIINVFIYSYSETADTKNMLDSETQTKRGCSFTHRQAEQADFIFKQLYINWH